MRSGLPPTHNKVFYHEGWLLPNPPLEGPGLSAGKTLHGAVCPMGQGHAYAMCTCLKHEIWSRASCAPKDRGNATLKILHSSGAALSGRGRPWASPSSTNTRPLPQEGNGCTEAQPRKIMRCFRPREAQSRVRKKRNKEIIVDR